MMEGKRTEGPWTRSKENAYSILTPQGGLIAKTSYHWVDPVSARLNAAFIVKACNEYEEMRAALVVALEFMEGVEAHEWNRGGAETMPEVEAFRQQLAKIGQA